MLRTQHRRLHNSHKKELAAVHAEKGGKEEGRRTEVDAGRVVVDGVVALASDLVVRSAPAGEESAGEGTVGTIVAEAAPREKREEHEVSDGPRATFGRRWDSLCAALEGVGSELSQPKTTRDPSVTTFLVGASIKKMGCGGGGGGGTA